MLTMNISARRLLNVLVILIGFTMALRTVAGLDRLFAYLLPPLICGFAALSYRHRHLPNDLRTAYLFVTVFFAWAAITSLWSQDPRFTFVRSLSGYGMTVLAMHCGYLWKSGKQSRAFSYLLGLNIAAVLLSLISNALHIPSNAWNGGNDGRFMGYFVHPNTLAALLLFTSPSFLFPLFEHATHNGLKKQWNQSLPFILLLAANMYIVICTYSRAALLVFVLIVAALCFRMMTKRLKLVFAVSMLVVFALLLTRQGSMLYLTRGYGTPLSNRAVQMDLSLRAAMDGGFFGLGYGTSDTHIAAPSYLMHSDGNILRREKGNSILAVIEETGLSGLLLFALPFLPAVRRIVRSRRSGQHSALYPFVTLLILGLSVHAQFEAWWVGISSIQYFIFFTFLGVLFRDADAADQANTLRP